MHSGFGTTSGVIDLTLGQYARQYISNDTAVPNTAFSVVVPNYRVSLSGSQTWYLNDNTTFSTSTMAIYGIIRARRMR